jgi:small subunit ribosomal protein S1
VGQEGSALNIPPRKVVKTLAVGQEVEGIVKRVTDFGAFVDIGVGRDGLVHVSEMGQGRVAKASDVVQEGDKVQVWVKELDRDKNRISLSMIAPGTITVRDLEEGMVVKGRVTRLERYGAFLDIGVGRDGMLHVKEMGRGFVEKPEDVVKIGDEMDVQILGIDRRRGRVDLSIKELLPPEPEPVAVPMREQGGRDQGGRQQAMREEEPMMVVEEEFLSPFEAALQQAKGDGSASRRERDKRKKQRTWEVEEDDEEDLIRRTIAHHKKSKGL